MEGPVAIIVLFLISGNLQIMAIELCIMTKVVRAYHKDFLNHITLDLQLVVDELSGVIAYYKTSAQQKSVFNWTFLGWYLKRQHT
ncbi:MAG: hypothetical protein U5K54_15300 [Cytophagales bacterium]|nr:hypothetical protein [Cytophagales bacterium]